MKTTTVYAVIALVSINAVLLSTIYDSQILNEYGGYSPVTNIISRYSVLLILPVVLLFMCRQLVLPSHIFFYFQALLLLYPQLLFWGISGFAQSLMPAYMGFLIFLFLLLQLQLKLLPNFFAIPRWRFTNVALAAIFGCLLIWFVIQFGNSLGFGIDEAYERRLTSFGIMQDKTVLRYGYTMACFGLASYFGFLGGFRLNLIYLLLAGIMGVLSYAISGEKMPALMVIISVCVGVLLRRKASLDPVFVQCVLCAGLLLAIAENYVFGNSISVDIGIRRMFFSQPLINEVAVEFTNRPGWNILTGSDFGASYSRIVGEKFFGIVGQNSNASPFVLSSFGGGILALIIELAVLLLVFWLLDSQFRRTGDKGAQWAGVFIGIMGLEQPLTTMLVTSGMAIILMAIIFGKSNNAKN